MGSREDSALHDDIGHLDCQRRLVASRGNAAEGVGRRKLLLLAAPSEWCVLPVWRPAGDCRLAIFTGSLPCLDARFGGHGAEPEAKGLVARFHDVVMVGESVNAIEKARPAPEVFANILKGLKSASSAVENALNSAVKSGTAAVKKAGAA